MAIETTNPISHVIVALPTNIPHDWLCTSSVSFRFHHRVVNVNRIFRGATFHRISCQCFWFSRSHVVCRQWEKRTLVNKKCSLTLINTPPRICTCIVEQIITFSGINKLICTLSGYIMLVALQTQKFDTTSSVQHWKSISRPQQFGGNHVQQGFR